MKNTTALNSRIRVQPGQWQQDLFHWFGLTLLCAAVLTLTACDPGSDSGEGIDPGIIEIPVAFIKRPIPVDDMGDEVQADVREPRLFMSGGDVYLRDSSAIGASVVNISGSVTGGIGDVKGLNSNHEGTKIIFSLRLFDLDPNNPPFPSWNIYEYDLTTSQLRRIITSQLTAELGDDLYPSYLPDGRILFTSNRQRLSGEMRVAEGKQSYAALDEDENTPALVLHVMDDDGDNIRQISFNQSHDLYPQVLTIYRGGRIVFSRWDNAAGNNEFNLYTANPDGSDMEILYGSRSHATGTGGANIQFTNFREMANGDLMVITKSFDGTFDGGDIVIIDADRFADISKPVWSLNGLPGPGQNPATVSNVTNDGSLSTSGRYSSAFPLWDGSNRILVTKSSCRLDVNGVVRPCIDPYLSDPAAVEKSPTYGIWLYDMEGHAQKPIVLAEAGMVMGEVITVENRTRAPVIFDKKDAGQLDPGWELDIVGVVNIRSVYDMGDNEPFNGCYFNVCTAAANINSVQDFADPAKAVAAERPARFVRFIKPVGIPDPDEPGMPDLDNNAFGPQRIRGMREIVGYAPVEPDGSVKVKVPANIPLGVEVLDGEGRRIGPQHNNWFQVQAGDTVSCVGCHDLNNGGNPPEIHARSDGEAPSINSGLPSAGALANTQIPTTTSPYMGTIGQTLAEVRFDSVALIPPTIQPQVSPDLIYDDYWTDPGVRAPDLSYDYLYGDLDVSIPSPLNLLADCAPWKFNCRTIINYPQQILAIWQRPRGLVDVITPMAPAEPPSNDPTNTPLVSANAPNGVLDDTCTECHTSLAGMRLPYGQLDLTVDPNQNPNDFLRTFRELLFAKPGRRFDGANLVNFTVDDGMGNQIDDPDAVVNPSMTANGARSSYFIEKMTGTELDALRDVPLTDSVDHSAMLTADELKLISEWLDLGAQNFNDPFDPAAPTN